MNLKYIVCIGLFLLISFVIDLMILLGKNNDIQTLIFRINIFNRIILFLYDNYNVIVTFNIISTLIYLRFIR